MENKGYDGPERREHIRIICNSSQRPSLRVQNHELEIVDISEGGLKIISNSNVMVFDEPLTRGTVNLLGGENIEIEGQSAWIKDDEIRLKFSNLIPSATIQKEREKFLLHTSLLHSAEK